MTASAARPSATMGSFPSICSQTTMRESLTVRPLTQCRRRWPGATRAEAPPVRTRPQAGLPTPANTPLRTAAYRRAGVCRTSSTGGDTGPSPSPRTSSARSPADTSRLPVYVSTVSMILSVISGAGSLSFRCPVKQAVFSLVLMCCVLLYILIALLYYCIAINGNSRL